MTSSYPRLSGVSPLTNKIGKHMMTQNLSKTND